MVIAQNVGFENVDYFCKMFKKYYKMTPTEYREKHITKGLDWLVAAFFLTLDVSFSLLYNKRKKRQID